jgi:hypothetical protein
VNNWRVIFATAVIFGAGVITGGLLVNHVQQPRLKSAKRPAAAYSAAPANAATNQMASKPQRQPEILSKEFLQRLDRELELSEAQHETIQKVINDGQNLIRKEIQDARLEIRKALTQEQRNQFDELIKRPFRHPLSNTNAPVAFLVSTNATAPSASAN